MTALVFFVPGLAAPQGSKRHVGHGTMIESSKAVAPWRDSVHHAAQQAALAQGWTCATTAIRAGFMFYFPRPASVSIKRRPLPSVAPDLSKLIRSTEDALTTSGVIKDDALIVRYTEDTGKYYTETGQQAGAYITLEKLSEADGTMQP